MGWFSVAQNDHLQEKDLRKLKRSELLEIMLAQSEEIDRLRAQIAEKDAQLQDRRIAIEQSGSIAEASLKLTKIFEEAQKAADLYLANVAPQAKQANEAAGNPETTNVLAPLRLSPRVGLESSTADSSGARFSRVGASGQGAATKESEGTSGKHFSS